MHCPNCGVQAAAEQKFCRACGLELQAIQQVLTRQLGAPGKTALRSAPAARYAWQLFLGVLIMFAGAGLLALEKRHGVHESVGLFGLLLTLGGPLLALYAVLAPLLHSNTAGTRRAGNVAFTDFSAEAPASLPAADTTSKLLSGSEVVGSVTEHTTRSLEPVEAPRRSPE